jgi:tRNA threonylcarbamoyladenosine biosynthesis protein TsaE
MIYNWSAKSVSDLDDFAKKFITLFPEPKIFALSGEMGNGKTTFIHALLNQMGIASFDGSPTFSLVNEYLINNSKKAYHIDCFRIENKNEVLQLGLDELIEEPNYFFIEWAEKIAFILPKDVIWVYIRKTENSTTREISFEL